MIKTSELHKGFRIRLSNGWYGTLADDLTSRNSRAAVVDTPRGAEMVEVRAYDIVQGLVQGEWMAVLHTPQQKRARSCRGDIFATSYRDDTDNFDREIL